MNQFPAIQAANPGLRIGDVPKPQPGVSTRIETVRAQQPGGALMEHVQSESVLWFEQLYRVLPPDGLYGATPTHPQQFVLGSFRVPESQVLVILDYAFEIYRFSGAAASDYLPIEESRLSTQVGWDIRVDNRRPENVNYQIIPQLQAQQQPSFTPVRQGISAEQWQFDQARAVISQSTVAPGLSLMPQRRYRPGRLPIANTYVARSGSVLSVSCNVINQIPIPVAFFEADVCGALIPQNVYDGYQRNAVPIGNPVPNPIPGSP